MAQQANHALPDGFQLEEYTITRQLSLGGFSIVYLATDAEDNRVAIKEYLPNSLALRDQGEIRPLITPEHQAAGKSCIDCHKGIAHKLPKGYVDPSMEEEE